MRDDSTLGCIALIATVAISVITGILAWSWVEPTGFAGAILFLLVWGIISYITYIVIGGIITMVSK